MSDATSVVVWLPDWARRANDTACDFTRHRKDVGMVAFIALKFQQRLSDTHNDAASKVRNIYCLPYQVPKEADTLGVPLVGWHEIP